MLERSNVRQTMLTEHRMCTLDILIRSYLNEVAGSPINWKEWSFINKKVAYISNTPQVSEHFSQGIPSQTNGADCGVFICQVKFKNVLHS